MNLNNFNYTPEGLANIFDQTLLKPYAMRDDFVKLCAESKIYGFKMVAINPAATELCSELLRGSNVAVGAAIGFPLGQNTIETKVFEAKDAIEKGAGEIDYVINISKLKDGNLEYIEREMYQIVKLVRSSNLISKVIFENCYLTEMEKIALCRIALKVGPNFIKTSTGFGTSGATIEDVKLMKDIVGDKIKVKAAGGIRDLKATIDMVRAGAKRIGTSAGVNIIEEYKELLKKA
ncbi:MAG TPA: deoxyribose-phosphate aldolase [Clostridiaceae bacterium]